MKDLSKIDLIFKRNLLNILGDQDVVEKIIDSLKEPIRLEIDIEVEKRINNIPAGCRCGQQKKIIQGIICPKCKKSILVVSMYGNRFDLGKDGNPVYKCPNCSFQCKVKYDEETIHLYKC